MSLQINAKDFILSRPCTTRTFNGVASSFIHWAVHPNHGGSPTISLVRLYSVCGDDDAVSRHGCVIRHCEETEKDSWRIPHRWPQHECGASVVLCGCEVSVLLGGHNFSGHIHKLFMSSYLKSCENPFVVIRFLIIWSVEHIWNLILCTKWLTVMWLIRLWLSTCTKKYELYLPPCYWKYQTWASIHLAVRRLSAISREASKLLGTACQISERLGKSKL